MQRGYCQRLDLVSRVLIAGFDRTMYRIDMTFSLGLNQSFRRMTLVVCMICCLGIILRSHVGAGGETACWRRQARPPATRRLEATKPRLTRPHRQDRAAAAARGSAFATVNPTWRQGLCATP
jgi:hypothetical protein